LSSVDQLFRNNREWAKRTAKEDPLYFKRLSEQQSPEYLWIGCSDSRVPANQIIGLPPGGVFVHRNIANLVNHTDLNALSVIQFAVDMLGVKHIMIVGHYGCSGISAAMNNQSIGLADNWIRHIKDTRERFAENLIKIESSKARLDRMCELNVCAQVLNVCKTNIIQDAWLNRRSLAVHGWIYDIKDGLLSDLDVTVTSKTELLELEMRGFE